MDSSFSRGVGRNKSSFTGKRSLNSTLLPNAKKSKPNSSQFGDWNNLWSSQGSQSSQCLFSSQAIVQTSPTKTTQSPSIPKNTLTPKKKALPSPNVLLKRTSAPPKRVTTPIKAQVQNPKSLPVTRAVVTPPRPTLPLPHKISPTSLPLKRSAPQIQKTTTISPQTGATPTKISLLQKKALPSSYKPALTLPKPKIDHTPKKRSPGEPPSPKFGFGEMFDDFDIDNLPMDMQDTLLKKTPPKTLPGSTVTPKAIEIKRTSPTVPVRQVVEPNKGEIIPEAIHDQLKSIHEKLENVERENKNMKAITVQHDVAYRQLQQQVQQRDKEIHTLRNRITIKSGGERQEMTRTASYSKFEVSALRNKNTQENFSSAMIDPIECSPNQMETLQLREQCQLQQNRLQLIVDILKKDNTELQMSCSLSQFPASKMEEIQKKVRKAEKEKIRARSELKKSEEESIRLFGEVKKSISQYEEISLLYEEEKKKTKVLRSQNKRFSEKIKSLTLTVQNLHGRISCLETIHSLESKLGGPRPSREGKGGQSKAMVVRNSGTARLGTGGMAKTQSLSVLKNSTSVVSDSRALKTMSMNDIQSVGSWKNQTELFQAMETIAQQNVTEPENRQLLVSWLNSQIDDINADPTFQEETTKNAFARVERI